MIPTLGPAAAGAVDAFLNKHCRAPSHYGELEQLRRLFTWRFRRGLERLLNGTLRSAGTVAVSDVRIAWIDKNPIASAPCLTKGTELGDVAIFSIDQQVGAGGSMVSANARAVILQAKIATAPAQIAQPSVPVNQSPSTSNELHLLSSWPVFDLRAAGASKSNLLDGVNVAPKARPGPHAWFIAAPGADPGPSMGWRSWWMAGEPSAGAPCATTFGELLVEFLNPTSSGRVGHPFTAQSLPTSSSGRGGAPGSASNWSDLCNTIRQLVPRYGAPRKRFALPTGQFGPAYPRVYSIPRHAAAFLQASPFDRPLVLQRAAQPHPHAPRSHLAEPFSPISRGGPIAPERDEPGMFVITVTTTNLEGH